MTDQETARDSLEHLVGETLLNIPIRMTTPDLIATWEQVRDCNMDKPFSTWPRVRIHVGRIEDGKEVR